MTRALWLRALWSAAPSAGMSFTAIVLALSLGALSGFADDKRKKEEKAPPPEDISLQTRDGVELRATYFPGTKGKDTVPVVILHGWQERREFYGPLALFLQSLGHAVVVPDLRGHGGSTTRLVSPTRSEDLKPDRLGPQDLAMMIDGDLAEVKKFLFQKHNAGDLNIELLCIVGSEFGATLALNFTMKDWSWPQLPQKKQGRDVKALVLISPLRRHKSMNDSAALAHPLVQREVSVMLINGRDDRPSNTAAQGIHRLLERVRPALPESREERMAKQDLFWIPLETSLQGKELIGDRAMAVPPKIAEFIRVRLVNRKDQFAWQSR